MHRRTACLAVALAPVFAATRAWAQPARSARVAWVSLERTSSSHPSSRASGTDARPGMDGGPQSRPGNLVGEGSGERLQRLVPEIAASRPT